MIHLNLSILKLDGFLLVFVDPATEDGEQQLPGVQESIHGSPEIGNQASIWTNEREIKRLR